MPHPAVVHLIGYPASGKLTVARALVTEAEARGRTFVLLDNHLTADAVLSVIDRSIHPIPTTVWDRVEQIRDVVYRAIVDLSPPDWSFVVTNVVRDGDQREARTVERVRQLAEERASLHVPVRVVCERDEVLRRVTAPDRFTRHKWVDPDGVGRYMEEHDMIDLTEHDPLEIDTTHISPRDSARQILAFIDARQTTSRQGGPSK